MKRLQVKLILMAGVFGFVQAQNNPAVAEVYKDEITQLEQLLSDYEATPSSQNHPMISTFSSALLQLMSADEDCYQVKHSEIADLAATLARLTNSLSYPCEDEAAYQAAQAIDQLARSIRDGARINAFDALAPPAIDQDTAILVDLGGPQAEPLCIVTLSYVDELPSVYAARYTGLGIARSGGRFAPLNFAARAHPSGGAFDFSITEQDGHPLVETSTPTVNHSSGTGGSILKVGYKLQRPTPGYYIIQASVTYVAPNGAKCHDKVSATIRPPGSN